MANEYLVDYQVGWKVEWLEDGSEIRTVLWNSDFGDK